MTREEVEFYVSIREVIDKKPEMLGIAIQALTDGLQQGAVKARKDQADWEAVAFHAMHSCLFGDWQSALAQRIEGLAPRAAFRWDDIIEKLKAKAKK
jgi:hypothetical protein